MTIIKSKRKIDLTSIIKNYRNIIFQLILIIVFTVSYYYIFDRKLDMSGDNFNYINYAVSISEGNGYSSPYNSDYNPTNWYPPGYSSILAIVIFFAGKNIMTLKIINGLFFIGSILIFNALIRKLTKNTFFAFSISFILILNTGLLMFSSMIMSEIPYLFFTILAFYLISRLKDDTTFWKSGNFYFLIFASAAAYYLRSQGIILAGAIAVFLLIKKNWKIAVGFFAGFSILYLPWIIRNVGHGIEGRYLRTIMIFNPWKAENEQINSLSEFIEKLYVNLHNTVIIGFTEVLFPFIQLNEMPKALIIISGIFILSITLFGAWKIKRFSKLFIFFILGNILIFLLWHVGNASRYVWTLAPFITFCFFNGIYIILSLFLKTESKKISKILPFVIILLSVFYIPKLKEMHQRAGYDFPPGYKNYFLLATNVKWMNNNNLVIACRKPGMFHFYSGTFVTKYKYSHNEEEVLENLIDKKVDFVVLEHLGLNSTSEFLVPVISKYPELFHEHILIPDPNTFLLKFNREEAENTLLNN